MSDQELKLFLAKMLPEKIIVWDTELDPQFSWKSTTDANHIDMIPKESWLHVCWLVEQTLMTEDFGVYERQLDELVGKTNDYLTSASWQQRALALCKVKG